MTDVQIVDTAQHDVFLSYNRADAASVAEIRALLETRGLRTFFDAQNLVAGLPWPRALEQALSTARSAAVFIGPRGLSPWQRREMYFALDRQAAQSGEESASRSSPLISVF